MRALTPTAAALLILSGCAEETRLRPSPGAQVLQGDANAAKAATDGIVLVAGGTAWKGTPKNLERGRMTGFLYFQGVGAREGQVVLEARLVDAERGEPLDTLDIPFQVRRD